MGRKIIEMQNEGNNMKKTSKEGKNTKQSRQSRPFIPTIREDFYDEGVQEGLKEILTSEQMLVTEKLIENTLKNEERWIAYLQGYNASEIANETGYSRANIAVRIKNQIANRDDADAWHKENRDRLFFARGWYIFVYLSDKAGDYRQSAEFLPKSTRTEDHMYRQYLQYGGTKLEQKHLDKRHDLPTERVNAILELLNEYPIEQVAFQERVYVENIERMAKENNKEITYEKDLGESREYTEKYNRWVEKRTEENRRRSREESELRRKQKEQQK